MQSVYVTLMSLVVFLPALGSLVLLALPFLFPKDKPDVTRLFTLGVTVVTFLLTLWMAIPGGNPGQFDLAVGSMQNAFSVSWIPSFNINYFLGMDGISFPLVLLSTFVSMLAFAASWNITKHVKGFCVLFLLLETGMIGVFLSLDFFLFYVFWEVMLLPMYFLIGVWGGPRKEYAAIKFFLYTLFGSVLMLIAILMLYFNSDVRQLAEKSDFRGNPSAAFAWDDLHISAKTEQQLGRGSWSLAVKPAADRPANEKMASGRLAVTRVKATDAAATDELWIEAKSGAQATVSASYDAATKTVLISVPEKGASLAEVSAAVSSTPAVAELLRVSLPSGSASDTVVASGNRTAVPGVDASKPIRTFNILALSAMGQHTTLFDAEGLFGKNLQWWAFVLLFIGFVIKVPSVPFHTWLPDAHVEAPTPISMILAGVLLKMGGYGLIRICYPICPDAGYDLAYIVCLIGVVSMVYGAFAALAQKDFKRMVAYSSVSHMGYVVLGLGVWSAQSGYFFNSDYWLMGVKGAMFQMIGHGISSPGMFFMVGIIYDRVHHRNLNEFGGLYGKMPVYTALAMGIFFAGLGLPGMCGFIGEVVVVLSVFQYSVALAVISAFVVIITAAYILWAIQRVYLGPEYKGPNGDHITPITAREFAVASPLFIMCIVFGVFPALIFQYMDKSVDRQVGQLATWTREVKIPKLKAADAENQTAGQTQPKQQAAQPTAKQPADATPVAPVMVPAVEDQTSVNSKINSSIVLADFAASSAR